MNSVNVVGNLTRDPESKQYGENTKCFFTIAVNRRRSSDTQQTADFIPVTTWNKLAIACGEYLEKGSKVAVTGRLAMHKYQTESGENRTIFEIVAESVEFIGKTKKTAAGAAGEAPGEPTEESQSQFIRVEDDDLPF